MESSKQIEIQLSKSGLTNMLLGSIAFVAIGLWFVVYPPKINFFSLDGTIFLFIVGLSSILFFGFIGFYLLKKLMDHNPGLIISNEGIYNNSGGNTAIFIPWNDIKEINETSITNQLLIIVTMKNPLEYIANEKNVIKKMFLKLNYKKFGTPVSITTNGLICNQKELMEILGKAFTEYRECNKIEIIM